MIFVHERMQCEAIHLKMTIEKVFAVPVFVVEDTLDRLFVPLPRFEGYFYEPRRDLLKQEFPDMAVLLLTRRDLYDDGASKDDEWVLGGSFGQFSVVGTARLMGHDSAPRTSLAVDNQLYLRRVTLMTIHELGHDLIKAPHHQVATWVNARTSYEVQLGRHCDDNSCAMYEVVDITSPPADEGYLKLGNERLYDAGVDKHLARLRSDWFCPRCREHVVVTEPYRRSPG